MLWLLITRYKDESKNILHDKINIICKDDQDDKIKMMIDGTKTKSTLIF